jgi:hypothetical protein
MAWAFLLCSTLASGHTCGTSAHISSWFSAGRRHSWCGVLHDLQMLLQCSVARLHHVCTKLESLAAKACRTYPGAAADWFAAGRAALKGRHTCIS